MRKYPRGVCLRCEREMAIKARGLCHACYDYVSYHGERAEYPLQGRAVDWFCTCIRPKKAPLSGMCGRCGYRRLFTCEEILALEERLAQPGRFASVINALQRASSSSSTSRTGSGK